MNIGLCGLGKAGTEFVRYICNNEYNYMLSCVLCRDSSSTAGKKVGAVTKTVIKNDPVIMKISDARIMNINKTDIIIDFSACETTLMLLDLCIDKKINLVICPTDFSHDDLVKIREKTQKGGIGVIYAPTLTLGVNLLMNFVEKLSRNFPDYKFNITEKHSCGKSIPSKTACYIRKTINRENIPIHSVRLNGYTGIHEVTATDGYERMTITHESFSRSAFVRGALKAAQFIKDKKGFYTIDEIYSREFAI